MQNRTFQHAIQAAVEQVPHTYPSLHGEKRSHVETPCAAYYLNRKPQTLRIWACLENGPICPIRINGRLAWPVDEIRRLLNGGV